MNLQKYLLERLEGIQQSQAIDIRLRNKLVDLIMVEIPFFIPCEACEWLQEDAQNNPVCVVRDTPVAVPLEVRLVGCDKAKEKIPF